MMENVAIRMTNDEPHPMIRPRTPCYLRILPLSH
jgi:hypothetical protein